MPVFRSEEKNVLFVHIPKTGGSAIDTVFARSGYQASFVDGAVGPGTLNNLRQCTPQHLHGAVLRELFFLERFDVIFMIVRDPVARFRSEYLWRNRDRPPRRDAGAVDAWGRRAFRRLKKEPYLFDNHMRRQVEFLVDGVQVYRFEDGLGHVVGDLNRRFGLELVEEVPAVRTSKDAAGVAAEEVPVPPQLAGRIRRVYRKDFARFGYGRAASQGSSMNT